MEIIKKVSALNLPVDEYVVFGSGILAVHGIRQTNDIDLFVTPRLFSQLKDAGWAKKNLSDGSLCLTYGIFEAFSSWDFGEYTPKVIDLNRKAEMVSGIPFAPLSEVLKWKQALGRDKDLRDIDKIRDYIAGPLSSDNGP